MTSSHPSRVLPGPQAQAYLQRDVAALSPCYSRPYPFVMDHGRGCEVWDVDGHRYLDFSTGIAVTATGHAHPEVVQAIKDQADRFLHMAGADFTYAPQIELAEKLNEIVPIAEETQVFLTNSGTESVEAAIKLARYATGRSRLIAFIGAFHGRSLGSLSLTASKPVQRAGFAPLLPGVSHVPYGYCYRCPYNLTTPGCDVYCLEFIEKQLFARFVPAGEVAAIFVEPIQGEGGYIVPPPAWLPRLRALCDRHGILLVADEVQTGFGRTGKMFAVEHWGVEPDIVCLAKGIASGMPLGAMVGRKRLMTWPPGAHANTYGGNPLACAASLATIRLLQAGYVENAAAQGEVMLARLQEMQASHPTMGDVRGKGLMIGVELVRDKGSKEPAEVLRETLLVRAFQRGLLLLGCGESTMRFMPALNVPRQFVDEALAIFERTLADLEEEMGLA
ncbi:MAG: acetyl ornithine aminotransferase family protein [Chloroflexi bacterium]|nr:acetyl ornithine aminotransferase family protein [Chloroflexota bacterium]